MVEPGTLCRQHCPNLVYFLIRYFPTVANTALQPPSWISLHVRWCRHVWVSGFKYMIFLGNGFLRYGLVSSRQPIFFVAIMFLSLKNAIETIKSLLFFKPAHLRKVSCTRNEMLKYDLLEFQSWSRCPPTCVGQGVAPNSNLPGASLILYLNLLTHTCCSHLGPIIL